MSQKDLTDWSLFIGRGLMSYLKYSHITKRYQNGAIGVNDVSFEADAGEFIVLIGTSGSGKTTLLRMINRLVTPTKGELILDGQNIKKMDAIALRRKIGYVVQSIGLMPHMTIRQNMMLVPSLLKWSKERQEEKATELIKLVDLDESILDRFPAQLSGGQQQRIGVARALAAEQDIILMDEPFGALDPITREHVQQLVKKLQMKLKKTIIFVTHDMDEALKLATHIGVMDHGQLIQYATPNEILQHPASEFVAKLIGEERLLAAQQQTMTVTELMKTQPATVLPSASIRQAIEIMQQRSVDTLLVVDETHHLLGVMSLAMLDQSFGHATRVADIYSEDIESVYSDDLLRSIVGRLLQNELNYIPVVNQEHVLLGLVTRRNLVELMYNTVWGTPINENEVKS
ncbi:ABC transporter ATP-binding protein [Weissella diestrammenae]|uniref:Quaternary amine transport ATP-binding protein n=2 Tax=Weissella diestrammenae TaxID=1162633 RepID=A0A7G9T534_9LACO|nr:ABC transporter ATP-binding protein [Weissella diestrammenae]QNN75209.1 ABC transporter ATP-binding protein [Weissella diestrammenae]